MAEIKGGSKLDSALRAIAAEPENRRAARARCIVAELGDLARKLLKRKMPIHLG
jgi:hypothetical protein